MTDPTTAHTTTAHTTTAHSAAAPTPTTATTTTTTRTTTRFRPDGRRRGRWPIVAAMVGSLALSAGARELASWRRATKIPTQGAAATGGTSLSGMNSFALGLLLGGLRGPLVMFLWTDSETNKTNRDLEGVNTEIEWIRLLQPEFDSVHLFQIWNKAYNISVQMASRANKYDAVLGGLDYAADVDRQKPDDVNIIAAVGQIYFDKFGTSQEKYYYRRRVRDETRATPGGGPPQVIGAGGVRTRLDPILDPAGNVIGATPSETHPATGTEANDRSPLQYLPQFGPYPDGVSTFALAYNYYKRSEVLLNVDNQHHENLSDMVLDSRPFLALREWAGEALDRGRRNEMQALLGVKEEDVPAASADIERAENALPVDHPVAAAARLRLAIADYDEVAKAVPAAVAENRRHVSNYPSHDRLYRLYVDDARSWQVMAAGDAAYLRAMTAATPADRAAALATAVAAYREAARQNYVILITYAEFTDPKFSVPALPPGYAMIPTAGQRAAADLPLQPARETFSRAEHARMAAKITYVNSDRDDYEQAIRRALARLNVLEPRPASAPAPSATPTPAE